MLQRNKPRRLAATAVAVACALPGALVPSAAAAAPVCGAVEVDFSVGAPDLQIAVWVEDQSGRFVDTAFVTRLVGQFGLGNRPGTPLLKTNFRWPYGRREMTLPVWAHRRDHHYPKVVMGGSCGDNHVQGESCNGKVANSPSSMCANGTGPCDGDCEDSTIAYHSRVSSYEPFYCSPSGPSQIDAMSCASKGTFAKGAFADPPAYSLYPPRADLNTFTCSDSVDATKFASYDDLAAISGATPAPSQPVSINWFPPSGTPPGCYTLWVEASRESDFNASHNHPNQPDTEQAWDFEGHPFLGQPSVVYKVPFYLGASGDVEVAKDYAGYGAWDGQDGNLRPPDGTITTNTLGSGMQRLAPDGSGALVKVVSGACGADAGAPPQCPSEATDGGVEAGTDMGVGTDGGAPVDMARSCDAPGPVTVDGSTSGLVLTPSATSIDLSFCAPKSGTPAARYVVRYHEGTAPITNENFAGQLLTDVTDVMNLAAGQCTRQTMHGLTPDKDYTVAVRGIAACGTAGYAVSSTTTTPAQMFTTLHGCFVATAAWGSPDDGAVATLRRMRDRHLLAEGNTMGRLLVATYYATSPSLASAIAGDARLRAWTRQALAPIVRVAAALP